MTLYELTGAYRELQEMAESGEFEPGILDDTIEGIEGELEEKAEGYAKIMANMSGDIEAIDAEIKRLQNLKKGISKSMDHMKIRLFESMKATGKLKFKTKLFSFGIQKNGGKQPMKVTDDLLEIPEEYIVTKAEPDNAKIREALESGQELSFAHLEERGESLVIK